MGKKPTAKQRAFAEAVVSGKYRAMTDAYREIYSGRGSRETVRGEASRLWKTPTVQAAAEVARERLVAARARKLAGDRDAVRRKLWAIADDPDARDADVLTACKLLGSQTGVSMFADRVEHADAETVSDAELIEEIRATLSPGENTPGDVSAPEVPGPPPGDQDPTPPSGGTVLN